VSLRRRAVLAFAAAFVLAIGGGTAARGTPTELFLSEYIEGTSNNKALEIFNGTGSAIDLAAQGYNVQMFFNGSATAGLTINLTGSVVTGDVYVLAHSLANAAILAQADQTNGAGWFNGDDAVVLRHGTTTIDVIGQVGFDPGTEWGAGLTSTMDNTLLRKAGIEAGDADGSNAFDPSLEWDGFATDYSDNLGTHSTGGDAAPFVSSTTPANGAIDVALDANVSVSFSEPVAAAPGWYSIVCDISGPHTAVESGGPQTYTLDPDSDFVQGDECMVTVTGSAVTDTDVDDPPNEMAANHVVSFHTFAPPPRIRDIQALSHISPRNGDAVSGVEGVVTALRTAGGRGFWFQDPDPDADEGTSEALFVFTNAAPTVAVGDRVAVSGLVSEFRPGGGANLTITEIVSPTVTPLSSGNPVPAPTVIGTGGRIPPTEVIDNDTSGDIELGPTIYDPAQDGIDFYESLEGMIVQVNDAVIITPTRSFGEIVTLPDDGAWASGFRTPEGGILAALTDFNPERVTVDDEILRDQITPRPPKAMPDMNVGDELTSPVVGPLDYTFANYKIQALGTPTFVSGGLVPEVAQPQDRRDLTVGTFNVENLDPGDGPLFGRLAGQVVDNLRSPDVIAIEEVQDNNGETNNGVVDASLTWQMLIAAIQAAGGPIYDYRQIDPVNNADGGAPGGNIRVGFLFRADRVDFVDRPGGDATTPTRAVKRGPAGVRLTLSPGRVDPLNPAWVATRKPLAGEFRFRGRQVFVIANHFSSKGADQPLMGHFQPPTRFSEDARHPQAQSVNTFVDSILALDARANVIVAGDINDFEFSETIDILEGGVMTSLIKSLPASERYSYVFEGNSQVLDQILMTNFMVGAYPFLYDVVHVNAEFADQASDHEPSVLRVRLTES
jgi:predicted extracellular nuclease